MVETDYENRRISNFQDIVTLTLDRVIRHTFVHHSSTTTLIRIGRIFCGRVYRKALLDCNNRPYNDYNSHYTVDAYFKTKHQILRKMEDLLQLSITAAENLIHHIHLFLICSLKNLPTTMSSHCRHNNM